MADFELSTTTTPAEEEEEEEEEEGEGEGEGEVAVTVAVTVDVIVDVIDVLGEGSTTVSLPQHHELLKILVTATLRTFDVSMTISIMASCCDSKIFIRASRFSLLI
jgi:hypothetical protein